MLMYDVSWKDGGKPKNAGLLSALDIRYLIAPAFAFALTVWIDPSYTGGDPSLYRYVYDALSTEGLEHGFYFYSVILSSTEPVYYLIVWTISHLGVPREMFIGISSAILAVLSVKTLTRRDAHVLIATTIVCSSFYFILLYTTTERLKIAVIFLIASLLVARKPRIAIFFAFLATITHIQVAILYVSFASIYAVDQLRRSIRTGGVSLNVVGTSIVGFAIVFAAYYVIGSQISSKAYSYIGLGEDSDLLRVLPFYICAMIFSKERLNITLLFIPIIALTPILGYGRLNIFSYFILLYYCVGKRGGVNLAVIITTVYFAYSSFAFISRIREFGEPLLVGQ